MNREGIIELAWMVSLVFDTRVDTSVQTIFYRGTRVDTRIFYSVHIAPKSR